MGDTDSENEGNHTNIIKLVIKPPGHTGKAQKGHLLFSAGYECANLGRVDFVSEAEFDLYVRPDTCNPRHRFWFSFSIENIQADQRIIFNIVNISKCKNLLARGLTPVVKSTSRPIWQRIPSSHVFYHRSPIHNNNYVLSWAFCFDKEGEVYQFAMCQPYSFTRQRIYLDRLLALKYNFIQRDIIGKSTEKRDIEVLTISDPSNLIHRDSFSPEDSRNGRVKVVFLFGRIHPGETPASFVLQGFLDFLVSGHEVAQSLREHVVFKVIPMLNPDGVFLGNQRCNLLGQDLNRAWSETHSLLHPELLGVKQHLLYYDNHESYELDMVLDVHAHTALTGLFVYGNSYDDVYRYERHIVFPKILSLNCEDFNNNNIMFNTDSRKNGSARRHLTTYLSHEVNTYTLEVSILGYEDRETQELVHYTDNLYCRVGRNLNRAFWDYYKITGVISLATQEEELSCREGSKQSSSSRNFNMERLREVAKQREEVAESFQADLSKKKKKKSSVGSQSKNELRINLMEPVLSSDIEDSQYSSYTTRGRSDHRLEVSEQQSQIEQKVLAPVIDLELNLSDKRDFTAKRKMSLASLPRSSEFSFNNNVYFKREESVSSLIQGLSLTNSSTELDISGLGPLEDQLYTPVTPRGVLSASSLGSGKKVGGGGLLSGVGGAPRPQLLKPYIQPSLNIEPTLTIIDFGELSKPLGQRSATTKKKRKKRPLQNKGVTKEEFFRRLYQHC